MKPVVTIFEDIHPFGIETLEEFADIRLAIGANRNDQLILAASSHVIIIKSVVQVDEEFLDRASCLRVIGRAGTGTDNIDLVESKKRGIEVFTIPLGNTVTAAEYTILQILFLCRRMQEVIGFMARGDYRRHLLEGRELSSMTVGIVGLGNVGMSVAERLVPFGCELIAWDPCDLNKNKFLAMGGVFVNSLDELLPKVEILTLHARLNTDSRHIIDARVFSLVKKGMLLVNNARAALIDDRALLDAIKRKVVSAAALDVLDPEPPFDHDPDRDKYKHDLLGHPSVFVTPHIGASTIDAQKNISLALANKIQDHFQRCSENYELDKSHKFN